MLRRIVLVAAVVAVGVVMLAGCSSSQGGTGDAGYVHYGYQGSLPAKCASCN